MKKIDRLEFLQLAGGILGAGLATAAAACGGDDSTATGAQCNPSNPIATIMSNHGHSMIVSGADVSAGVSKTYSIKGSATHDHMVTVSSFADLAGGKSITVASTAGGLDGHIHTITIC